MARFYSKHLCHSYDSMQRHSKFNALDDIMSAYCGILAHPIRFFWIDKFKLLTYRSVSPHSLLSVCHATLTAPFVRLFIGHNFEEEDGVEEQSNWREHCEEKTKQLTWNYRVIHKICNGSYPLFQSKFELNWNFLDAIKGEKLVHLLVKVKQF